MKNLLFPTRHPIASVACFCLFSISIVSGKEKEPESASNAKPDVTKIAGVLEAVKSSELVVGNEHLTALEIKRIVPHGTKVNKGQNVVWFDTDEFDKKIEQAEIDLKLAELTLESETFQHKQFLETQKLDKAAAVRARKQAQQKFDNFVNVDRDREVLSAQFNLKSSQASLDNATEELKQLEQMYEEDDLTEESEEIVLKRAKQSVEFAQFRLDGTKISSERSISQTVPRKEASEKESLQRAELKYQKTMKDLESARAKQEIEMTRKRDKFKDEQEKVAEMRAERNQMVLQAPHAGIVLYGKLARGKLPEKPSALKMGSKVTVNQVIATIVDPSRLQIRVDLDEKYLSQIKPGALCKIVVRAFADHDQKGSVKSVSTVPYAGTKYDCVVSLRAGKNAPAFLPTMGCDLEFTATDPEKNGAKRKSSAKSTMSKKGADTEKPAT